MKNKTLMFILFSVSIALLFFVTFFYMVYPLKHKDYIIEYSNKYSIRPELVAAIICAESRFDDNAKSNSGACGLMQLMPSTYSWICEELENDKGDIFDAKSNIEAGCFYFKYLSVKYKNLVYVLSCYNAGEGVVKGWGSPDDFTIDNINFLETKAYVNKVLRLKEIYYLRFNFG